MKTLITIGVAVLIVGLLAVIVIPGMRSHVWAWREEAGKKVDTVSTDEHLITRAREALRRDNDELKKYYYAQADLENNVDNLKKTSEKLRSKLEKDERNIAKARELLAKHNPGDKITIGDKTYTREQVNEDALRRIGKCENIRDQLVRNAQILKRHENALTDLNKNIALAKDVLREEGVKLDRRRAELGSLRSEKKALEILSSIDFSGPFGPRSESGRALEALDGRIARLQVDVKFFQEEFTPGEKDIVDTYDLEFTGQSAIDAIDSYFNSLNQDVNSSDVHDEDKVSVGEVVK